MALITRLETPGEVRWQVRRWRDDRIKLYWNGRPLEHTGLVLTVHKRGDMILLSNYLDLCVPGDKLKL